MRTIGTFDLSIRYPEDTDIEYKEAQGRDGNGAVPKSIWETYSAMANTEGGTIFLGLKEGGSIGSLITLGIKKPEVVQKLLWDALHDRGQVSGCILSTHDIVIFKHEDKMIIAVHVPAATRQQRPIYIGGNPLTGTYRRRNGSDYRCDEQTVKRMLADAGTDSLDAEVFSEYNINDLDAESLSSYRNELRATNPAHPLLVKNDVEFLEDIGGWGHSPHTGEAGPTLAGLLMFGKLPKIQKACPFYLLDYQERPDGKSTTPWADRVTTDLTWSGNLYTFFKRVYLKLTTDLKIPFQFSPESSAQRLDETSVHVALREALANTLIHADYGNPIGILIHKRADLFGFRNPGGMRVPIEKAKSGGVSDCRNRALQRMFFLIGKAEQAGFGIPRILQGWEHYHKQVPLLRERLDIGNDTTVLTLPLESLLPSEATNDLAKLFPEQSKLWNPTHRIAMVTAYNEGIVTNQRLKECTDIHSSDITITLQNLVSTRCLLSKGKGRGTWYQIPGREPHQESPFGDKITQSQITEAKSEITEAKSEITEASTINFSTELLEKAYPVSSVRNVSETVLGDVVVGLCAVQPLTRDELSRLLNRGHDRIAQVIGALISAGRIVYVYKDNPNHPQQSYTVLHTK